jgi:hypothetical protein
MQERGGKTVSISQQSMRQAKEIRLAMSELEKLEDSWAQEYRRALNYTCPLAEMVYYNYIRTLESEGRYALLEGVEIINRLVAMHQNNWTPDVHYLTPSDRASAALSHAYNEWRDSDAFKAAQER